MATIDVKDAAGATVAVEKPLIPGRAAAASSRPVVLSTEDKAALDALATALASILAKVVAAPSTEAKQDITNTKLDTLHADLGTTIAAYVDGLEALIGTTNTGNASILAKLIAAPATEAKQDTGNTSLSSIDTKMTTLAGYVDGLEALATLLNTYADGLETLVGTTNTNLTTLQGYVDGLEALITTLNAKDFATQTTSAAVLAKLIAAPATEAKQDTLIAKDFATQTTLAAVLAAVDGLEGFTDGIEAALATLGTQTTSAAILAKLIAAPSTEAKQDTGNTSLASIDTKITTLQGYVDGLEALVTSTNSALTTLQGYVDGLEGLITTLNAKDFATQATSAAVLAKIIAAPATEAKQDSEITQLTTAVASLSVLDDWDESDRAKVNPIAGQAGVQGGSGVVNALTQRTVLATDVGLPAGTAKIGTTGSTFFAAAGSAMARPANTTAYTANDAVSDNATAGSVTAQPITVSDTNNDPISVERVRLSSTDTGFGGVSVRAWLYNSDPTASSGVVGGDNAAFSNKKAGFIGTLSGVMRAMNDGSVGCLVPDEGSRVIAVPGSGVKTIWWQLQTLGAATPSANSTTFTPTVEGFQGRT